MTTNTTTLATLVDRFTEISTIQGKAPQQAIAQYDELIIDAIEEENFKVHIDCQLQLGRLYSEQGLAYKSIRFTGAALQLINLHLPEDKEMLALCYKELGVIYADGLRKYSIALDYFFKALKLNAPSLTVSLYNNIGSVYKDSKNFEKAIEYLKQGQSFVTDSNRIFEIFILENLGRTYILQQNFELAESTLLDALKIANRLMDAGHSSASYIRGYVLNSLGEIYLKTQRSEQAILLINEALAIAVQRNHLTVTIESLKNKSTYALSRGDDDLFLASITQAINYSEKENLIHEGESCMRLLKDYYWSTENYKDACVIGDKIIALKTKVKETHESNSIADVLEQRESEIVLLEEDNRIITRQKEDLQQFSFIVAHDLKEPLRSIGSYSGLIKRRYSSQIDKEGREFLDFILQSSSHMYKMLEDLLKYVTLNEKDNPKEIVDINNILANIRYRLKDRIEENEAEIIYDDLPSILIRPTHLFVLLENLIRNALKFKSLDRNPVIHINVLEEESHFRFSVTDNGKGIGPEYFQNIFQIFKQLEKNKYKGTGIGLSVCKKIVETYDGDIWVESEVNKGSSFHFTIAK